MDILLSKSEIVFHWKDKLDGISMHFDYMRPCCWACGFSWREKYYPKLRNRGVDYILGKWDKIPLQRCHILPRALNGKDQASNLFLMCRECHDHSPNTIYENIFFSWVRSQDFKARACAKLKDAFLSYGIESEEEQNALGMLMKTEEYKEWINGKFSIHRAQSKYPTTMSSLTPASMVGLALQYNEESIGES